VSATDTTTAVYSIEGMSCGHCVAAVEEEVGALEGVDDVAVELESGTARVTGSGVSDEQVLQAVAEAGYSASRSS
jgi:copper ion binding protein